METAIERRMGSEDWPYVELRSLPSLSICFQIVCFLPLGYEPALLSPYPLVESKYLAWR